MQKYKKYLFSNLETETFWYLCTKFMQNSKNKH